MMARDKAMDEETLAQPGILPVNCAGELASGETCCASPPIQAFFIGEEEEGYADLPARRPSSPVANGVQRHSHQDAELARMAEWRKSTQPPELSNYEWFSSVREQLAIFSDEMLRFRGDLSTLQVADAEMRQDMATEVQQRQESLADALDGERLERMAAFEHCEALASDALDVERRERLAIIEHCVAQMERLSQEVCRSAAAVEEEASIRIASFGELACAQEADANERVALEVSVHHALQTMHADFDEEVAERTALLNQVKQSLDREVKERCEEQDKHAGSAKEILEVVERECQERRLELDKVGNHLLELQAGVDSIDGACRCVEQETMSLCQALDAEAKERGCCVEDMRQQLGELETKLHQADTTNPGQQDPQFSTLCTSDFKSSFDALGQDLQAQLDEAVMTVKRSLTNVASERSHSSMAGAENPCRRDLGATASGETMGASSSINFLTENHPIRNIMEEEVRSGQQQLNTGEHFTLAGELELGAPKGETSHQLNIPEQDFSAERRDVRMDPHSLDFVSRSDESKQMLPLVEGHPEVADVSKASRHHPIKKSMEELHLREPLKVLAEELELRVSAEETSQQLRTRARDLSSEEGNLVMDPHSLDWVSDCGDSSRQSEHVAEHPEEAADVADEQGVVGMLSEMFMVRDVISILNTRV